MKQKNLKRRVNDILINIDRETATLFFAFMENLPAEKYKDYIQLVKEISNCKKCRLCNYRKNPVPGEGPIYTRIMIIGEAPGYYEDIQAKPFVGRAGHLLTKMLNAININRDTVYITNIIKCRPPENRDPMDDEISACMPYLERQIELIKPEFILTLGRWAIKALVNTQEGIKKIHGKIFTYKNIKVVPTFHPAALLRNQDLKKYAWEDLKIFRSLIAK